ALQRPGGCETCGRWPSLLRGLHDLVQAPVLRLRERARLDDAHDVADLRGVLLVVRVELRRAANDLLVARVGLDRVDLDDDRLVHRARDDDAAPLLTAAALDLGLREPDDRLARLRLLALRLRALWALRAREALALWLLLRGRRRGGLGLGFGFGRFGFGRLGSLGFRGRCLWLGLRLGVRDG